MHLATLRKNTFRFLAALSCALLASCGGSSSSSSGSSGGPSSLFPKGVVSGSISFGGEEHLEFHVQFLNSDGINAVYSGSLDLPVAADSSDTEDNKQYFNGTNMRKTEETTPGRLVFYFDELSTYQPLVGRLVLSLTADEEGDAKGRRTGVVETSTDLRYSAPGAAGTKLEISGVPVTVTWSL